MRRLNWLITMGLLFLAALAFSSVEILFRWRVHPELEAHQKTQQQHYKLYSEDVEFLRKFEFFFPPQIGSKNAGLGLNSHVHWIPAPALAPFTQPQLVSQDIQERLIRLGEDWIRGAYKLRNAHPDLSLFKVVGDFDYWDIESDSPIATLIRQNRFVPPTDLPIPDPRDLMAAAKLRLIQGTEDGDPLTALKQVRQLSRLLLTTENLQLYIAALSILDDERRAYRHYVDELGMAPNAWEPFDRNITRRAHRAVLATRGYQQLWTPSAEFSAIFLSPQPAVALCGVINDSVPIEMTLRPLLDPHWPLERDYRSAYARVMAAYQRAETRCRLTYLEKLMSTANFSVNNLPGPFVLNRLPYWRKLFAMKAAIESFSGFEIYDQLLARTDKARSEPESQ